MQKGLIARQGIIIGMIEKNEGKGKPYRFTYDPGFNECYQLDDLKIRDDSYLLMHSPFIMLSHLYKVDRKILEALSDREGFSDLDLWLDCCDLGLIPEEDGCRI